MVDHLDGTNNTASVLYVRWILLQRRTSIFLLLVFLRVIIFHGKKQNKTKECTKQL